MGPRLGHESEIFERLGVVEVTVGKLEEWKSAVLDRLAKLETEIADIRKTVIRSDVRLGLVMAVLIFTAQWVFNR
mgnify:CR=1 FL=1